MAYGQSGQTQEQSTTGVGEVGEFVEMCVGTWEVLRILLVET